MFNRKLLAFVLVGFTSIAARAGGIILPPTYNELQDFESEWCDQTPVSQTGVLKVESFCYGRVSFQNAFSSRAFRVVVASQGGKQALLYVEAEHAPVELLKLEFAVLGPVNQTEFQAEFGEAKLEIDRRGEVISALLQVPSMGLIRGQLR